MPIPDRSRFRRVLAIVLALVVVLTAVLLAWEYRRYLLDNPLSEDAVLQADAIHISPAVPGRLTELAVKDGQRVEKGQLLFRIEPEVYALRLRQAEAELAAARATLASRDRQIRAETANSAIAQEQIARARANLDLAETTVRRLEPLAAKGYATRQELDTARTAQRDAQASLAQARSQAEAARELIGETEAAQAAVDVAQAAVALARKALSDTVIRAPYDGLVVGLSLSEGEHLAPGESVFTLINTDQWYATAFFRETDIPRIPVRSCATVYVLADPTRAIGGRVASIGWGVSSEEMVSLPRSLPYVQKSLNWVRVAQRFPVRIALEDPPADLMRVGASSTVVVRRDTTC